MYQSKQDSGHDRVYFAESHCAKKKKKYTNNSKQILIMNVRKNPVRKIFTADSDHDCVKKSVPQKHSKQTQIMIV